jgi:hypothetical protein
MLDIPPELEARMTDGALQIQRLVIATLRDGHGYTPNSAAVIPPTHSRAFAEAGVGTPTEGASSVRKLGAVLAYAPYTPYNHRK